MSKVRIAGLPFHWTAPVRGPKLLFRNVPKIANVSIGGRQADAIATLQTGLPVVLTQSVNQTGLGNTAQRPNVNGQDPDLANPTIDPWFDTSVFSVAPAFTFGNGPRTLPKVRQPGLKTLDLSLFKSFPIRERATLTFRAETFNALNTTRFGPAASVVGNNNLGVISSTADRSAGRSVRTQIGLLSAYEHSLTPALRFRLLTQSILPSRP